MVLCIDAAYHSHLNSFLDSVTPILNSKGRLGFHYLMRADSCHNMTMLQEQKHRYLLKAADVTWDALLTEEILRTTLEQQGFTDIKIEDLSEQVLLGFHSIFKINKHKAITEGWQILKSK